MFVPNSPEAKAEAQRLWEKACELTKGEIILHENQGLRPPGFIAWIKLKRASSLFKRILVLVPNHWNSMWLLGKVTQRLGNERGAFDLFNKAWDQKPGNIDVAREAALSAMHLGFSRHAIEYCEEGLKLEPNNPGMICNLGLALIHDGKPQEALTKIKLAVQLNPSDSVSVNVLKLAVFLIETNSSCPSNSAQLQKFCQQNKNIFSKR